MRLLLTLFSTILSIASCVQATAQVQAVHLLRCDAVIEQGFAKQAVEDVKSLDPAGAASWDGQFLKVRVNASITLQELLAALNHDGVNYAPSSPDSRSGMPILQPTGDSAADEHRYQLAKERWIREQQESAPAASPAKN
jgi:hypothetical protein